MSKLEYRRVRLVAVLLCAGALCASACDDSKDSDDASDEQDEGSTPEEDAGDHGEHDAGGDMDAAPEDDAASEQDGGAGQADAAGDGGGADASAAPTCAEYCTTLQANCTAALAQYSSMGACMAVCTSFPLGTAVDTMGNTLGCRLYHAGAAAGSGATIHCNHAGITGGDKDVSDTAAGTCGEGCDAFCNEALVACTAATTPGGTAPYATKDACMAECKMFPASTTNFSTAATSGNTFHCRAYHLTAASTGPNPHCGHIKLSSPTCN